MIKARKQVDPGIKLGRIEGSMKKKGGGGGVLKEYHCCNALYQRTKDKETFVNVVNSGHHGPQQKNLLSFNEVKPPNVQNNPLPDHGSSSNPAVNMIDVYTRGMDEAQEDEPASPPNLSKSTKQSRDALLALSGFFDSPVPEHAGHKQGSMHEVTPPRELYSGPSLILSQGKCPTMRYLPMKPNMGTIEQATQHQRNRPSASKSAYPSRGTCYESNKIRSTAKIVQNTRHWERLHILGHPHSAFAEGQVSQKESSKSHGEPERNIGSMQTDRDPCTFFLYSVIIQEYICKNFL
ncbi:hypothetical protein CRG98_029089 [Punica granatum]|uniref:Uncharacterized protein n=1 Tax=Punica granatum TaxID=22663 RepID=A0A2I0J2S4_PUNGR|nr:hypothetical protein CRG98_029089 [Punica granatum]